MIKKTEVSSTEIPGHLRAEVQRVSLIVSQMRAFYGAVLETSKDSQKFVASKLEQESSLDNLCVEFNVKQFEDKYETENKMVVTNEVMPSEYTKKFASCRISIIRKILDVCSSKEGMLSNWKKILIATKIKKVEKYLQDREYHSIAYTWNLSDKLNELMGSIRKLYDIDSVKVVLTGIDEIPPEEQPDIFNFFRSTSFQSFVLASEFPETHRFAKDGLLIGFDFDRLNVVGFNQPKKEDSTIVIENPELKANN